jgi:hypothetical protein
MSNQQDDPAYGEEYDQSRGVGDQEGDRGIVGDTFRYLKGKYKQSQQPQQAYGSGQQQQQTGPGGQVYNVGPQSGQQPSYSQGYSANQPPYGQAGYVRSHLLYRAWVREADRPAGCQYRPTESTPIFFLPRPTTEARPGLEAI